MKNISKIIVLLLAAALVFGMSACGAKKEPANDANNIVPTVEEGTMGAALWNSFVEAAKSKNTAIDIAKAVASDKSIEFSYDVANVAEGDYLPGLSEEVKGFKDAACFAPMMSSIAFVSYVFELEDGADVAAFAKTLTDNANPRWNICVEADQTVVGSQGNYVFFLMCPARELID